MYFTTAIPAIEFSYATKLSLIPIDLKIPMSIFLSLDENQCELLPNNHTRCIIKQSYFAKRAFVMRWLNDIDGTIAPISEIIANRVEIEISEKMITAFIDSDKQRLAIIPKAICDAEGWAESTFFGSASFPARLSDFLSRS